MDGGGKLRDGTWSMSGMGLLVVEKGVEALEDTTRASTMMERS